MWLEPTLAYNFTEIRINVFVSFKSGQNQFSPVPPLKNLSWVLLVPKMLRLTLFSLSIFGLLSPLGFSNSTTPSEEETSQTLLINFSHKCKIFCLYNELIRNLPNSPTVKPPYYLALCCWWSLWGLQRSTLVHLQQLELKIPLLWLTPSLSFLAINE